MQPDSIGPVKAMLRDVSLKTVSEIVRGSIILDQDLARTNVLNHLKKVNIKNTNLLRDI